MQIPTSLYVRTCLGVAWSAHFVLHLMAEGEGLDEESPTTSTVSPDNSSYAMDNTTGKNFTWNWDWLDEKDDESFLKSKGFINAMVGVGSAVIGIVVYVIRKRYREQFSRSPVQVVEGENAAPPPPSSNGGAPVPQTWDLAAAGNASSLSSLSSPSATTTQPSAVFSTSSSSGIDYSNNNFLSNYSSAANYSSFSKF